MTVRSARRVIATRGGPYVRPLWRSAERQDGSGARYLTASNDADNRRQAGGPHRHRAGVSRHRNEPHDLADGTPRRGCRPVPDLRCHRRRVQDRGRRPGRSQRQYQGDPAIAWRHAVCSPTGGHTGGEPARLKAGPKFLDVEHCLTLIHASLEFIKV